MKTFENNTAENRKVLLTAALRNWDDKAKRGQIFKSMNHMLKSHAVIVLPSIGR